ncbi:transposase family protein [Onishia niordana]|uniref:transposase family protein n=1 Tax=Onishia niordana TaxID=2508711 RepID=UPI00109FC577|nr:transposase family protein [Halomonas niordiana]
MLKPSLRHNLSIVPDFRQAWKVQHQLLDILFMDACAVICGAEGWIFLASTAILVPVCSAMTTLACVMALLSAE